MTTMPHAASRWDIIVVGAGHNGLTAGALLARAGLAPLVVDLRAGPGRHELADVHGRLPGPHGAAQRRRRPLRHPAPRRRAVPPEPGPALTGSDRICGDPGAPGDFADRTICLRPAVLLPLGCQRGTIH